MPLTLGQALLVAMGLAVVLAVIGIVPAVAWLSKQAPGPAREDLPEDCPHHSEREIPLPGGATLDESCDCAHEGPCDWPTCPRRGLSDPILPSEAP